MRNPKPSAKRSEKEDTGHSAVTFKNVPAVIQSGTSEATVFRCLTVTANSRPLTHTHTQHGAWDLIIGHPPCTYLSNAGAVRLFRGKGDGEYKTVNVERLMNGIRGRDMFMTILNADCEHIAVENPVPSAIFAMPEYTQIIEPWQFGHPYSKRTCLWLKNLPPLKPTDIVEPVLGWVSAGSKKADGTPREYKGGKFRDSKTRSKTFKGIAEAMADQWTAPYDLQMRFDI